MSDGNDLDQRRTASRAAREKRKGLLRELRLEQQKKKDAETQKAKKPWYQQAKMDEEQLKREIELGYIATEDSSEARKKARMLRNRRSAELSRKRKRDRLQQLEKENSDLSDENLKLQKLLDDQEQKIRQLSEMLQQRQFGVGKRPLEVIEVDGEQVARVESPRSVSYADEPAVPLLGHHAHNHNSARVDTLRNHHPPP
uniref:BZIP domain-containing protein n=1 Tax=Pinguiococcus pyrenoidosus TaxID=172671 RepID=A0A7R9U2N1_9STRA